MRLCDSCLCLTRDGRHFILMHWIPYYCVYLNCIYLQCPVVNSRCSRSVVTITARLAVRSAMMTILVSIRCSSISDASSSPRCQPVTVTRPSCRAKDESTSGVLSGYVPLSCVHLRKMMLFPWGPEARARGSRPLKNKNKKTYKWIRTSSGKATTQT